MNSAKKYGLGAAGLALAAVVGLLPNSASAAPENPFASGVQPAANPRTGVEDNVLISSLRESSVAWGRLPLTNPDATTGNTHYGYNTSNTAGRAVTQDLNESFKTEPDKNVYLVFNGKRYLYQGHELGPRGYVTRVDLDQTDPAQRVTLIAQSPEAGVTFDGMTWDPWSHQLLLTAESASPKGGVFAVGLNANGDATSPTLTRLPAMGSGGYEGIQNDSDGNVWIVEDIGGPPPAGHPNSKVPNSYVYRFTPTDRSNPGAGGKLEALQVQRDDGQPVTAAGLATGTDPFLTQLHTYGSSFTTMWVTVADPADSTAGAKAAGATPFKRPENGVFRPGSNFREFYFTETGDTNANSDVPGAFGAVFRLAQSSPSAPSGRISPVVVGDVQHTGLDNIQFATKDQLLVVEDAGDTLHQQRNALDSGYLVDLGNERRAPDLVRWLSEGRDASATFDSLSGPSYNDKDNEVTGIHVSDGDPSVGGLLGTKLPTPFTNGWRAFWTQQHGDNVTWELASASTPRHGPDQEHGNGR